MGYGNEEIFLSPEQRENLISKYLGRTVTVVIDRPIGYHHVTKGIHLDYTVNYGFLPGVTGGDGEEQDVYVLGVQEPLETFTGRIIGVIRRRDDNEDKFVAAPEGLHLHQAQIAEAVHFVETYFDSKVDSLLQCSCGVIPYRRTREGIRYLLLKQTNGFWSFPKGHMEAFESEEETALRELKEETDLTAKLRPDCREAVCYSMAAGRRKLVVVFPGEVSGEILLQQSEVTQYRWAGAEDAKQLLHKDFAAVIDRVQRRLEE